MPRFTNLTDTEIIKDTYPKINTGFANFETDVNAHFAGSADNHDASDVVNDSTVTGARVDDALDDLQNQIDSAVLAASNANIGVFSVSATGTNTLTTTITDLPSYFGGLKINLTIANNNTGAVTLNVNALGAKAIKKVEYGAKVDIEARDVLKGTVAQLEYDGTDFILLNPAKDLRFVTNTEIGVAWNQGDDDVFRVSRAKDYTQSDFNTLAPWVNIKRCLLADDLTVNAYLDATDSYNLDGVAPSITGTADATTANKLADTGAFTLAESEYVGKYVKNTTDDTYAMITAKDDNDTLSLSVDIFVSGEGYEIQTAILDGSGGQVMVEVPKFWYRSAKNGKSYEWYISDVPRQGYSVHPSFVRDGAEKDKIYFGAFEGYYNSTTTKMESRANVQPSTSTGGASNYPVGTIVGTRGYAQARNLGADKEWEQRDFLTTSAIQLLYLVEYATFDSQTAIGKGVVDKASGSNNESITTGRTLFLGNASGRESGTDGLTSISYRGIENFYGNIWEWTDGINLNNYVAFVADHGFESNKFTSPYVSIGNVLSTNDTFVTDINYSNIDFGFLASAGGGSSSSHLHDKWFVASGQRAFRFGGSWSSGAFAGAFYWSGVDASSADGRFAGARLLAIPKN
jgi:hypothetical protein